MAFTGQVLDNPISGERFIFSETAANTGGELLAVEFVVAPDGHAPGGHVHPVQEERFEVVRGRMRFKKGRKTVLAGPGDTLIVPPGTYHRFANAGDSPAVIQVEVRPALKMEQLWETTVALAAEGRTLRSRLPRPWIWRSSCGSLSRRYSHPSLPGWSAPPPRRWPGWPSGAASAAATRRPRSRAWRE